MTSAAILAGGRARRFGGADKTQLRVGGRTILDRQVEALRGVVDRLFLVGYRGAAVVPPSLTCIADRTADQGPLGGLEAALEAADTSPVLLLACDLPYVTTPLLAHLLALTADGDAVVPRTERGYHPLCAAYTPACRRAVERRMREGQRRMVDLLDDLRVRVVEPEEIAMFGDGNRLLANVNSQAELDAVESLLSH
jgi:molybdopterin-guanine dinucleotide biosynthesis protein A